MTKDAFKIDFVGIGAQRCGTTWIAKCLEEHPQVCLSSRKEAAFFNKKKESFKDFKNLFCHCKGGQIKGEYSPQYMHPKYDPRQISAQKIKDFFPQIKLIACLRNPIERAFSHYQLEKFRNGDDALTFERALDKNKHKYIEAGFYFSALKKYFDLFPEENILVLIYEDIQKNPLGFMKRVYRFLGVEDDFVAPSVEKRITPLVKKKNKAFFYLDKTSSSLKERSLSGKVVFVLKKLKINSLINILRKRGSVKIVKSPPAKNKRQIKQKTREKLSRIYEKEIKSLEKVLGRDLSFWK